MRSYIFTFAMALSFLSACAASPTEMLEERSAKSTRSGKATGGPASATVTVVAGPYTCPGPSSVTPTDGSAGAVVKTFTITEAQCQIVNVPFGGAITAKLTATPKAGTAGCYIQVYQQQGCGVVLGNQYHGFPFDGVAVGNQVGCAQVPEVSYGALAIVCG